MFFFCFRLKYQYSYVFDEIHLIGHASCWMQDNQELLKKINLFEGDPNKVFTSRPWMDQRKGKKKGEAKLFQEFDHGKDEFV